MNENFRFVKISKMLTDKEMDKLKEEAKGDTIVVKVNDFEQLPELETLGFIRLEDRIKDPLYFSFDTSEYDRKNFYIYETNKEYVGEAYRTSMLVINPIIEVCERYPNLNLHGKVLKKNLENGCYLFYTLFWFHNSKGTLEVNTSEELYDFYIKKLTDTSYIDKKDPRNLEKRVSDAVNGLFDFICSEKN